MMLMWDNFMEHLQKIWQTTALCDAGMTSAKAQVVGEEEGDGSLDIPGLQPCLPDTGQIHTRDDDI